jgi:hypothetical protein
LIVRSHNRHAGFEDRPAFPIEVAGDCWPIADRQPPADRPIAELIATDFSAFPCFGAVGRQKPRYPTSRGDASEIEWIGLKKNAGSPGTPVPVANRKVLT